jgi:hypothetical protein
MQTSWKFKIIFLNIYVGIGNEIWLIPFGIM